MEITNHMIIIIFADDFLNWAILNFFIHNSQPFLILGGNKCYLDPFNFMTKDSFTTNLKAVPCKVTT